MKKKKTKLRHIHLNMLPNNIQTALNEDGFSLYKNILIVGDKASKKYLINFVDKIPKKVRESLLLVFVYGDTVELIYK